LSAAAQVLAADVGGTNCRFAIYGVEDGVFTQLATATESSQALPSLADGAARFARGQQLTAACVAIAGPVAERKSAPPNLPWTVDADELARALGLPAARVDLINDFAAVGHGVLAIGREHLLVLQKGQAVPGATMALIGAGTGLGEAFITFDETGRPRIHPTEGGHADFAPRSRLEHGVAEHIATRFGRCSVERVISGPGIVNIHTALVEGLGHPLGDAVKDALGRGDDPAAVIHRLAESGEDTTCALALDLFIGAFGAEAGNMALRTLALGGVVLAGGIAPRLIDRLRGPGFLEPFRAKGRFAELCASIPVSLAADASTGLQGAAHRAAQLLT
jgi:glucokinase